MNAGQLGIRRALQTRTTRELGKQLACSPGAVSMWAAGKRLPTWRFRQRLHALLGLELDSWEREATELITHVITNGAIVGQG